MFTKVISINKLKAVIAEVFFNRQSKVTTLSDDSAISATFYSIAKIAQKATGDIALVESQRLPKFGSGDLLDSAGTLYGTPERLGASTSSTYLKVIAEEGTFYQTSINNFSGQGGIQFELTEDVTIGSIGYAYIKVRSTVTGSRANVNANTITTAVPAPTGHTSVVNTVNAIGGRDEESDSLYRDRITSHNNTVAVGTLSKLIEVARTFNSDVLDIKNYGTSLEGKTQLAIVLQNGAELSDSELDDLLTNLISYFNISDINKFSESNGIELINPSWWYVGGSSGIDFRVDIYSNYSIADVRQAILEKINNYLDFRNWDYTKSVEWDDLLALAKSVSGVRTVLDNHFYPSVDEKVPYNQYPRVKNFIMRDLDGNILLENETLIPIYYPTV